MEAWIGGIQNSESGTHGDILLESLPPIAVIGGSLLALITLLALIWLVRVRPRKPQLEADWNSDCALTTTAEITGSTIRYTNVRDFFWRTTRDRDEAWQDTLEVDADEIKDVWFVVDHFHSIHGLAHTFLTFEFNDGTCLSFSFEARRRKGQRYHPWTGLWRHFELYLLVGFEHDVLALRTNARGHKDYLFRGITPPGKEKALLLALTNKANSLAGKRRVVPFTFDHVQYIHREHGEPYYPRTSAIYMEEFFPGLHAPCSLQPWPNRGLGWL